MPETPTPTADELRDVFDRAPAYTIGVEEEVMLLAPDSLELVPRAAELVAGVPDDPRFKLELPASQVEIVLPPLPDTDSVSDALLDARTALAHAAQGLAVPAAAGVHPFSAGIGELNRTPRYAGIIREYGAIATRQLVCSLQVHVAVGSSDRALAVYNALRPYLPVVAALAANAPFYEGRDTGLASVRPKLCELLPRQGVPPAIESWEDYAGMLRWGARAGTVPEPRAWWWELRLHPVFGTLELRVPDAQTTVADAAAIAAVIHALSAWLGARHEAGERISLAPRWQIEENRWSACRYGVEGTVADALTGEPQPTARRLLELLDVIADHGEQVGAQRGLEHARAMVKVNGAIAQRRAAASDGARGAARWLADQFLLSEG